MYYQFLKEYKSGFRSISKQYLFSAAKLHKILFIFGALLFVCDVAAIVVSILYIKLRQQWVEPMTILLNIVSALYCVRLLYIRRTNSENKYEEVSYEHDSAKKRFICELLIKYNVCNSTSITALLDMLRKDVSPVFEKILKILVLFPLSSLLVKAIGDHFSVNIPLHLTLLSFLSIFLMIIAFVVLLCVIISLIENLVHLRRNELEHFLREILIFHDGDPTYVIAKQ